MSDISSPFLTTQSKLTSSSLHTFDNTTKSLNIQHNLKKNDHNPSHLNSILNPSNSTANLSKLNNENFNKPNLENEDNDLEPFNESNDNDSTAEYEHECENEPEGDNNNKIQNKLSPRKRSKVSRACDECRRKKIRCNAILDLANNSIIKICTNCDKNNETCMFTRIPLKRGPTKGYNKKASSIISKSISKSISEFTNKSALKLLPDNNNNKTSNDDNNTPMDNNNNNNNESTKNLNFTSNQSTSRHNPFGNQQFILPPLNSISFSDKKLDTKSIHNQTGIFWKVPTDMPNFSDNIISHDRKGSIDSVHSALSTTSSISSTNKSSIINNNNTNNNNSNFVKNYNLGIENSDSEDEFFANNSNRLSRSSFQVPFPLQNKSPRLSFNSDKDSRSSISSVLSSNSYNQQNYQFNGNSKRLSSNNSIAQNQYNFQNFNSKDFKENLFSLLDNYYSNLYPQYPLLPNYEIMKISIDSIIDNDDFQNVIGIFFMSLQSIIIKNLNDISKSNFNTNLNILPSTISVDFANITKAFEIATSMFLSKSLIYSSKSAKIILTSSLVLLNYSVVISGLDYSLGFGIAFSYFKDWLIFKEGYDNPCFANLIQLVVLDSLHTLYYGLPRSSTVCFAIDSSFIDTFLNKINFPIGTELEWLTIGLHLVVLNNKMQELDTLDKLDSIEVTGTKYKFMSIIKLYYDLFIYCRQLNSKIQIISDDFNKSKDNKNNSTLSNVLQSFIYNIELDLSKICKKITNLIDEQLDDLELARPNVLISLIAIKCIHISINTMIFVKSIIYLNDILESANKKTLLNLSTTNTLESNFNNKSRSRSSSASSVNSFNSSTSNNILSSLSDCNQRFFKIAESIGNNINRCVSFNQTHQHSRDTMNTICNSKKTEILVPRTSSTNNKDGIEYFVVLQNWIRLVNSYFAGEITKEGINGWCCT